MCTAIAISYLIGVGFAVVCAVAYDMFVSWISDVVWCAAAVYFRVRFRVGWAFESYLCVVCAAVFHLPVLSCLMWYATLRPFVSDFGFCCAQFRGLLWLARLFSTSLFFVVSVVCYAAVVSV